MAVFAAKVFLQFVVGIEGAIFRGGCLSSTMHCQFIIYKKEASSDRGTNDRKSDRPLYDRYPVFLTPYSSRGALRKVPDP